VGSSSDRLKKKEEKKLKENREIIYSMDIIFFTIKATIFHFNGVFSLLILLILK
jgi:hypothetical protein